MEAGREQEMGPLRHGWRFAHDSMAWPVGCEQSCNSKNQCKLHRRCSPQRSSPKGYHGLSGGEGGKIPKICDFLIFAGFRGPEGVQGGPGARGYILTEFGFKQTHQTPVHTKFDDFTELCMVQ